jgi:hypothetical protein
LCRILVSPPAWLPSGEHMAVTAEIRGFWEEVGGKRREND